MKQGDVIATISLDGDLEIACWCQMLMSFTLGEPSQHVCTCGAIWAWSGNALQRRPSARRARLSEDGEIVRDEQGGIVWEWAEKDMDGRWADGR